MSEKQTRMSAADRRALVVEAATRAFARSGYAGTTTDAVAKEAGVSQPYVVRIFGSKEDLFIEVLQRTMQRICEAFTGVIEQQDVDGRAEDGLLPLGTAYADLVLRDRDLLGVMMHGIMASAVPGIGAVSRQGMAEVHRIVLSTGCEPEQARDFVAHGMLINVLLAMGSLDHVGEEPALDTLADGLMGDLVGTLGA